MTSQEDIHIKRVHFSGENEVFVIERSDDTMNNDDKALLWYTDEDEERIKRSIHKTLKSVRNNPNNNTRCILGLEHMIDPEGMNRRKMNVDFICFVVLSEQHRQQTQGIRDAERIRNMSLRASQWARSNALE
mmetsp:Transcript_3036/g.4666  ORF Transcript_3036/g.4666 Transcript_3036/m.4666 type:complete len:132 (-) Transcript_3036:92-487(-)|eukprot:12637384-Ditylum_brightwellii.AAC.1